MKKCTWCGQDYPDSLEQCPIDAQPLTGDGGPAAAMAVSEPPSVLPPAPPGTPGIAPPAAAFRLSDRQLRIFECVLLCVIAFGGSIYYSAQRLLAGAGATWSGNRNWLFGGVHQLSGLALLGYILLRRSRSWADIGFSWAWKDILRSVGICLLSIAGFFVAYGAIYFMGLTSTSSAVAGVKVRHLLFGRSITFSALLYLFINPFYEELIVRAYLMTEVRQLTHSAAKAILASTLLQMSYHFYQGAPMAFSEGAAFLVFSIYYARTNRIMPLILAHLYIDLIGVLPYLIRQD